MSELIYHDPGCPVDESPFDREILKLSASADLSIVSPYISLEYLRRITARASSWRLITDVTEWLVTTSVRDRARVLEFLGNHDGKVHNFPDVHAKVVIGQLAAYTGSANLTRSGILRRTEMGIVLKEKPLVAELQRWFDTIWLQSSPASVAKVALLVEQLNAAAPVESSHPQPHGVSLESEALKVRARYSQILGDQPTPLGPVSAGQGWVPASFGSGARSGNPPTSLRPHGAEDTPAAPATGFSTAAAGTLTVPRMSLEAVVDRFIEQHHEEGFALSHVHTTVREEGPLGARVRDTYFELLNYCASLPQSIFVEESVNRLVFRDGTFKQSNKERLASAMQAYDLFVEALIRRLSFDSSVQVDLAEVSQGRLAPAHRAQLMAGMTKCGMLRADSSCRTLNSSYTWTRRDKLLAKSEVAWQQKLGEYRRSKMSISPTSSDWLEAESAPVASKPNQRPSNEVVAELLGPLTGPAQPGMPRAAVDVATKSVSLSPEHVLRMKLDMCFLHMAKRFLHMNGHLRQTMKAFVEELARQCGIPQKQLRKIVLGSIDAIPNLFYVPDDAGGKPRITIVQCFAGNKALDDFPKTREFILSEPYLRSVLNSKFLAPSSAEKLASLNMPGSEGKQTKVPMAAVDAAYKAIARRIYKMNPSHLSFRSIRALTDYMVVSKEAPDQLITFLLSGQFPPAYKAFSVQTKRSNEVALSLNLRALPHYPQTKAFIEDVAWKSLNTHAWLAEGNPADEPLVVQTPVLNHKSPGQI